MYEVLISKANKKLEQEGLKRGFEKVFFIDEDKFSLLSSNDLDHIRREISRAGSKGKKIILWGSTDQINRIAVEDKRVSMLLSPEEKRKGHPLHFRDSGLNEVLCKLALKSNVAIGISFSAVKSLKGKNRAERIARIMQNIELCRKYGAKIVLASFGKKLSDSYSLRSFGSSLGMSTEQVKDSLESAKAIFGDSSNL